MPASPEPDSGAPVGGGIEVQSDDTFRRREFAAESVGWLLLALVLVAAMLGLLGRGPVSSARAESPSGRVTVDYERIAHREADDTLVVEVERRAGDTEPLRVHLSGEWLADLDLRGVSPEPSEQTGTPDGLELVIPTSGTGRIRVVLSLRTRALGLTHGSLRAGGEDVGFTQLVLP